MPLNKAIVRDYKYLLGFVALLWMLELVNLTLGHRLNQYGMYPRDIDKWYALVSMHLLHANPAHLISNTLPLLILGFLVCMNKRSLQVSMTIALMTGLLVWAGARPGNHIGASGLVMGYFGYLLSIAFIQRDLRSLLLTIVAIIIYGGLLFTLIDFRAGVSFEGHIFGFLSGVASALIWHGTSNNNKKKFIKG